MSSWKKVTLEDISESINTGLDAIRRAPIVDFETDIKCLRIQDISQNKPIESWGFTEVKNTDYSKFRLMKDDIIMARTCSTGICFLAKQDLPAVFNNGLARIRLKKDIAYPTYVYYVFKSKSFISYIDGISGGTSVQLNMKIGDLSKYSFDLPPLNIQKEIANKLSDLDKKIQLNTQINQTLEQIAQTIFKSWFIDFDPVHAKANALASGQTAEQATQAAMAVISGKNTQELHRLQTANPEQYQQLWEIAEAFPSGVDEEGLPWGWIRGNIGAITKAKRLKVGCVDAIVLSAVSSSELIRSDELFTKQVYSKSIEKYLQVHLWDFAYNPSRINIGSIGLLKENIIGAVSPVYEVFSVKEKYHWFLEKILSLEYTKKYIQTLASGSVRQSLKLSELQTIPCVIPNEFIMDLFNSYYISFLDYITNNEKQNTTLSNIRDELLPKLLSGEILNGN